MNHPQGAYRDPSMAGPATVLLAAALLVLAGCASVHSLMPTPVLYTGAQAKPLFADAPITTQVPALDLLFITDRKRAKDGDEESPYTADRSRSIAFGSTMIEFGDNITWDWLVKESTAAKRTAPVNLKLGATTQLGRFPPIPYRVTVSADGAMSRLPEIVHAYEQAKEGLQADIVRRLAVVPRKEVVLYVHGYRNSFETAALTMGELCHFLGREFVCGIFTWPAGGRRGILFGYDVDIESGEFAVEDLVKTIRIVATTPGVQRLHLLAHSRGNEILASALAELGAEAYMLRGSLASQFHIGNIVVMAPDIDADVALSKIFKVFSDPDLPFGQAPDADAVLKQSPDFKVTIYVSPDDRALATSGWLFGSIARLGRIDADMFTPQEIKELRDWGEVDVIQVRGKTDLFGHSYFVSNPEVSADIIATLRYGLKPNDPGRPLQEITRPFWRVMPVDAATASQ